MCGVSNGTHPPMPAFCWTPEHGSETDKAGERKENVWSVRRRWGGGRACVHAKPVEMTVGQGRKLYRLSHGFNRALIPLFTAARRELFMVPVKATHIDSYSPWSKSPLTLFWLSSASTLPLPCL